MFGLFKRKDPALDALTAAVAAMVKQHQTASQTPATVEGYPELRERVRELESTLRTIQAEAKADLLLAVNERKVARRAEERARTDLNRLDSLAEAGEDSGFDLEDVADAYAEHGLQLEHGGSLEAEGVSPMPTGLAHPSRHAEALAMKFGA